MAAPMAALKALVVLTVLWSSAEAAGVLALKSRSVQAVETVSSQGEEPDIRSTYELVARSQEQFNMDFYQELVRQDNATNRFYSPMSISTALALVYAGAGGNTATQMEEVLHFEGVRDDITTGYSKLLHRVTNQSTDAVTVKITNNMYLAPNLQLQAKYADDALENFNVAVQAIDFSASQAAANHINGVVRNDTEGLIDNLISPDSLNSLTVFVIVNAIYFKGAWQTKFLEADTAPAAFHTLSGATKTVQMMRHWNEKFSVAYLHDLGLNARALALPYQGEDIVMLVLLPRARDGIHAMERGLNNISLTDVLDRTLASPAVSRTVHIPKFKLEADLNLVDQLTGLNMTDLFTRGLADLSGIVEGGGNIYVSSAVHKAFVEVNEEGTEAAAATGLVAVAFSSGPQPFVVNHPFVFAIMDVKARAVLFMGRVVELGEDPAAAGEQQVPAQA